MRFNVEFWTLLACGLAFFLPALAVAADDRERFEARTYTDAQGDKLLYRLLTPKNYDPNKKYPLVVFLHGAGERGNDNFAQLKHGMADFASDAAREKHPAFVMAPQCPTNEKWVDVDWSSPKSDMPERPASPMRLTLAAIEQLQKEYSIDADRLYLTGLSMGGYGTWDALQRHPRMFAAAIPICGGGDPKHASKFVHVPLWAFHGDKDTAVKPERSREMIAALKAAGGSPQYTEYKDVGHDSWTATYKNSEVIDWLFAQKRQPAADKK
ncbi:MAG: prolyl oligopeptidase family serine peptidase [Pirellulales bacterium]